MNFTSQFPGIESVRRVASQLEELNGAVVYVGGATVGFYLTDPIAKEPRPTRDVDVVVEITTHYAYARFEKALRAKGFQADSQSGVICRYVSDGLVLDVMPTGDFMGFTNRWYPFVVRDAVDVVAAPGSNVRIATPPCFLATKVEAFNGRGNGDFAFSPDLEDIVSVIDFRPSIVEEIQAASDPVRSFLRQSLGAWLEDQAFLQALSGHLLPDEASQGRRTIVLDRIGEIVGSDG